MRAAISLSLCSAIALAIGVSDASAQMTADEIANRLKAQQGVQSGSQTRGLRLSYGEPAESAAPAAGQSVVSVPAPSVAAPPVYTDSATDLTPTPSYTSVTIDAPAALPAVPSYQPVESVPTYVLQDTAAPEAVAVPVVAPLSAESYTAVDAQNRVDLRIYFEWNSASLKPEAIGQLAELCAGIRAVGATEANRFKIIGHTDKSGTQAYNLYLSKARAREVKRHLVEECQLPAAALLAVGEGENQSSPTSPANAPDERRVEIQLLS